MRNTIDILLEHFGWQGGTIHQCQEAFDKAHQTEKDLICGKLADERTNDPEQKRWFMENRMKFVGIRSMA